MDTDKLFEALSKKAINEEKARLERAWIDFNKTIGLAGTSEKITLTDYQDKDKSITMYTKTIFVEIARQLLEKREEKLKTNAVSKFLTSVENFKENVQSLEKYMDEMERLD